MKEMTRIATRSLKPGMTVENPIMDQYGRILVESGTILTSFIIQSLLHKGIAIVYIRKPQIPGRSPAKNIWQPTRTESNYIRTERTIERLRKADPDKVRFSDTVRQRVLDGIQFIYKSPNPQELASATNSIANDLLEAVEAHESVFIDMNELKISDEYTFKHSVDVATISMVIGRKLGLRSRQLHELATGGLLHDLGKIKVPDHILNKPARLTAEEFEVMKKHPEFGFEMIRDNADIPAAARLAVLQHHEKLDGSGYPFGIKAERILLCSRIIAVADIYDALVTARPYKEGKSPREAIEILMCMSSELDLDILNAFFNSMLLYPLDTVVELSNGEQARVVAQSPYYIFRPTVVGLKTGNVYTLDEAEFASIVIL